MIDNLTVISDHFYLFYNLFYNLYIMIDNNRILINNLYSKLYIDGNISLNIKYNQL